MIPATFLGSVIIIVAAMPVAGYVLEGATKSQQDVVITPSSTDDLSSIVITRCKFNNAPLTIFAASLAAVATTPIRIFINGSTFTGGSSDWDLNITWNALLPSGSSITVMHSTFLQPVGVQFASSANARNVTITFVRCIFNRFVRIQGSDFRDSTILFDAVQFRGVILSDHRISIWKCSLASTVISVVNSVIPGTSNNDGDVIFEKSGWGVAFVSVLATNQTAVVLHDNTLGPSPTATAIYVGGFYFDDATVFASGALLSIRNNTFDLALPSARGAKTTAILVVARFVDSALLVNIEPGTKGVLWFQPKQPTTFSQLHFSSIVNLTAMEIYFSLGQAPSEALRVVGANVDGPLRIDGTNFSGDESGVIVEDSYFDSVLVDGCRFSSGAKISVAGGAFASSGLTSHGINTRFSGIRGVIRITRSTFIQGAQLHIHDNSFRVLMRHTHKVALIDSTFRQSSAIFEDNEMEAPCANYAGYPALTGFRVAGTNFTDSSTLAFVNNDVSAACRDLVPLASEGISIDGSSTFESSTLRIERNRVAMYDVEDSVAYGVRAGFKKQSVLSFSMRDKNDPTPDDRYASGPLATLFDLSVDGSDGLTAFVAPFMGIRVNSMTLKFSGAMCPHPLVFDDVTSRVLTVAGCNSPMTSHRGLTPQLVATSSSGSVWTFAKTAFRSIAIYNISISLQLTIATSAKDAEIAVSNSSFAGQDRGSSHRIWVDAPNAVTVTIAGNYINQPASGRNNGNDLFGIRVSNVAGRNASVCIANNTIADWIVSSYDGAGVGVIDSTLSSLRVVGNVIQQTFRASVVFSSVSISSEVVISGNTFLKSIALTLPNVTKIIAVTGNSWASGSSISIPVSVPTGSKTANASWRYAVCNVVGAAQTPFDTALVRPLSAFNVTSCDTPSEEFAWIPTCTYQAAQLQQPSDECRASPLCASYDGTKTMSCTQTKTLSILRHPHERTLTVTVVQHPSSSSSSVASTSSDVVNPGTTSSAVATTIRPPPLTSTTSTTTWQLSSVPSSSSNTAPPALHTEGPPTSSMPNGGEASTATHTLPLTRASTDAVEALARELQSVVKHPASQAAEAAGAAASIASMGAATAGPGALASASRVRSSARLLQCEFDMESVDVDVVTFPIQFALNPTSNNDAPDGVRSMFGAVLCTTILVAAASIATFVVQQKAMARDRHRDADGLVDHLPPMVKLLAITNAVLLPLFGPPLVGSVLTLALHVSGLTVFAVAVLGTSLLVVLASFVAPLLLVMARSPTAKTEKEDEQGNPSSPSFLTPPMYVYLVDATDRPLHTACRLYFFEDVAFSVALEALSVWYPGSSYCGVVPTLALVIAVAHIVYLAVVRPYSSRVETIACLLVAIVQALSVFIAMLIRASPGMAPTFESWLVVLFVAQILLLFLQPISIGVAEAVTHWSNSPTASVRGASTTTSAPLLATVPTPAIVPSPSPQNAIADCSTRRRSTSSTGRSEDGDVVPNTPSNPLVPRA